MAFQGLRSCWHKNFISKSSAKALAYIYVWHAELVSMYIYFLMPDKQKSPILKVPACIQTHDSFFCLMFQFVSISIRGHGIVSKCEQGIYVRGRQIHPTLRAR